MGFSKGQKVTLKNAQSYESSTTSTKGRKRTGTFYIWSAATKNGRIRITEKKSYVGKEPAGKYVLCWVKTSSIGSSGKKKTNKNSTKTKKVDNKKNKKKKEKKNTKTVVKNITESANLVPKESDGQIGYLGKVLFVVKDDQVQTVNDFAYTVSASYAEHERHLKTPLLEFTGLNSQTITFNIELSAYLGQESVMSNHKKLHEYMKKAYALPMKLGETTYGKCRWCIKQLALLGKTSDTKGNWTSAKLSVSLISATK
jgi:hypothetical protein